MASAGAGVVLADDQEQAHGMLHFQAVAHHHDDDHEGGIHRDDSGASALHLAADAGQFSPALMTPQLPALSSDARLRPQMIERPLRPLPCLDGLERPPRAAA